MDNLPVLIAAVAGVILLVILGWVGLYQVRLRSVSAELITAEDALDEGDLVRARSLVAPLLSSYPAVAIVQEVAGDILYAGGDPFSAAAVWEKAMRSLGPARIAPRLAAAYAALNRAGDARRVAALAPDDRYARLVHAWAELVALGGDRTRGAELSSLLSHLRP